MALSKPKVVQTLALLTFLMLFANQVHSQIYFTVDSFDPNPSNLIYQGDAHVPSGSTSLRLTKTDASGNPQPSSVGRVLYSPPVTFWAPSQQLTFETTLKFVIKPVANHDAADGLTFFIAPVNTTIPSGSDGANLGIFGPLGNGSSIFAVEFDVYVNGAWDPNYPHIGIDINSRDSRSVTRFEDALGQVVNARINYVSNTRTITVVTTYGSKTAELSYVFNLKTILPEQVQVGISASTGAEVANFEVSSWYFSSTLVWDPPQKTGETYIHPYV